MKIISPISYLSRLRRHLLPILVWLSVVACVVGLFTRRSRRFEVLGIAQGQVRQIAANCTGRLKSVPVQLFEQVSLGQPVAVVDTIVDNEQPRTRLQAQLSVILAEIEHLTAQLVPTQDDLLAEKNDRETNRLSDGRRFSVDVENARLEILRLRAQIETDKIMLEDLALEVQTVQELLAQEAVAPYELQKANVQYETLAKKIEENEQLLEQAKAALKQTQQRWDEYARYKPHHPSVEDALDVIRKAIKIQERRMDELLVQIEALVPREALKLTAPIDGVVSQIQRWPGEAVLAGEPILTIAEVKPTEIIAYAVEDQVNQIQKGMVVELVKKSEPEKIEIARSQIIYIGPIVEQLPARLWRNPNVPEWGRPFLVKAPPQMKLIIGEVVGIRRL
ncbi:MAG TPA: HlyD family efflux transporter periplasmic adaptor subunit [Sedimentisphaerales bacterium]|nr:HlyD family efflux transporter periplasmic adaptor subunit [Sedimentisphaerales bacterium]